MNFINEQIEANTKAKLLLVAKHEFLKKGFSGANVREIAKKAGLTTGAIYNQFDNKDGLFEAIVRKEARIFLTILDKSEDSAFGNVAIQMADFSISAEVSRRHFMKLIDFFYQHWEEMKLVFCCSSGSSYEQFLDTSIGLVESKILAAVQKNNINVSAKTKFFIHVMVSTQFSNMKEIFDHELKKEEATQYILDVGAYHAAGWKQYWNTRNKKP